MAIKNYYEIITEMGIDSFNAWRDDNQDSYIIIDLRDSDFSNMDLRGANLSDTILAGSDFENSDLRFADLYSADLRQSNLKKSDLRDADLSNSDLRNADLSEAQLDGAKLCGANLSLANLKKASLRKTDLSDAELVKAKLIGADLQKANLTEATLSQANLMNTNLAYSNLSDADLINSKLQNAKLTFANLSGITLYNAEITGVSLYGTIRDDWEISGVKCKFVYWTTAKDARTPGDRFFRPKEFEELNKQLMAPDENLIIRTIEFPMEYFQAGISILSYFGTVLQKKYKDNNAKIQIKQDGLKVTLIIDPADSDRKVVEKTLDDYGLTITGNMSPQEFAGEDELLLLELKSELRSAHNKIDFQKELIQYQNREVRKQDILIDKKDIQIDKLIKLLGTGIKSHDLESGLLKGVKIFISYSRDDKLVAERLYYDLKSIGAKPWIDSEDMLPGANWKDNIFNAIKECSYFFALFSHSSITRRGFVKREQKIALELLDEFPENRIFIIPIRINECDLNNEKLNNLHCIDLFYSYSDGFKRIIRAIEDNESLN